VQQGHSLFLETLVKRSVLFLFKSVYQEMPQTIIEKFLNDPDGMITQLNSEQLAEILGPATSAYHNTSTPLITDDMYDMLKLRLVALKPTHPLLKQIGAPLDGEKVALPYWMGSLDKIKDDAKSMEKFVQKYPGSYVISDKLDGVSGLLHFNKGQWHFYTRGDGTFGRNISKLLPHIKGIPSTVRSDFPKKFAVRGEIILSRASWIKLSAKGSNARNVMAGTVNAKTPDPEILSEMQFVVYDMYEPRQPLQIAMTTMKEIGLTVVEHRTVTSDFVNVENLSQYLLERRKNSPFEVDGIVITHNEVHTIGKGKNPKHSFAFKSILTHEEAEVIVSHVEWNASKDGYLKPLVHFNVVNLNGVKIQKATGFNAQFIEAHAIGPGSRIVIVRSGDVIPHILRVVEPSFTKKGHFPKDIEYDWNDSRVDIVIKNKDSDVDVQLKRLEHFVGHIDINYLAKGTLAKLYAGGFTTIPKILAIKESDMLKLEGFQTTGASKIVKAIADARAKATCADYMVASNIFGRGLGKKKLVLLLAAFPDVEAYKIPKDNEVNGTTIPGIGEKTIQEFIKALPEFFKFAKEIKLSCLQKNPTPPPPTSNLDAKKIQGKAFVFTGFRNKDWEQQIDALGGTISATVSKKTSFVIAKSEDVDNSKVTKAKGLGIPIVREESFITFFS